MLIPASDSSAAILARTPFVLLAFSDTIIDISLKFLTISQFLKRLATLLASSFSRTILIFPVPLDIRSGGSFRLDSFDTA